MKQKTPSEYLVCVRLPKSEHSDPDKLYRVGHAQSLDQCQGLIADDLRSMGDTLGGLIEATSVKGRKYEIFKATWTKVKCP